MPTCARAGCDEPQTRAVIGVTFRLVRGELPLLFVEPLETCFRHADDEEIDVIAHGLLAQLVLPNVRPGQVPSAFWPTYADGRSSRVRSLGIRGEA